MDEQPPSAITPNAASTVTVVPRLLRAAGPVAIVIPPWFARVPEAPSSRADDADVSCAASPAGDGHLADRLIPEG